MGCLAGLVLGVAALGGFFLTVVAVVNGSIRSSWAYTEGLALARDHPDVVAALGEPIVPGWPVTGSVSVSGATGEVEFSVPLRGPAGRGRLHVVARMRAGEWSFERAEVKLRGSHTRVDLLSAPEDGPAGLRAWRREREPGHRGS